MKMVTAFNFGTFYMAGNFSQMRILSFEKNECFSDVGLLTVSIDNGGELEQLAVIEGDRGNVWRFQQVPLMTSTKYQVSILSILKCYNNKPLLKSDSSNWRSWQ